MGVLFRSSTSILLCIVDGQNGGIECNSQVHMGLYLAKTIPIYSAMHFVECDNAHHDGKK